MNPITTDSPDSPEENRRVPSQEQGTPPEGERSRAWLLLIGLLLAVFAVAYILGYFN